MRRMVACCLVVNGVELVSSRFGWCGACLVPVALMVYGKNGATCWPADSVRTLQKSVKWMEAATTGANTSVSRHKLDVDFKIQDTIQSCESPNTNQRVTWCTIMTLWRSEDYDQEELPNGSYSSHLWEAGSSWLTRSCSAGLWRKISTFSRRSVKATVTGLPRVFVAVLDRRRQNHVARCRTCPDSVVWVSLALPFVWMMTHSVTRLLRHLHPLVWDRWARLTEIEDKHWINLDDGVRFDTTSFEVTISMVTSQLTLNW